MTNTPPKDETFSNSDQQEEKKPQFKRPEFILIDDREGKNQYTYFKANMGSHNYFQKQAGETRSSKSRFSLRFICFLGFIFCLIFGLGILLWSIAWTFLNILSFFQNRNLRKTMQNFWKIFINTLVTGFSFMLGIISPTLGLGLLAIYFSLASDLVEENLLRRVIRHTFNRL